MRLNSDYYDTDFEIAYKGNKIFIKNEGPEGESLYINSVLQDQNYGSNDGHLVGCLYDEENSMEVIEVYLGGSQTEDCLIYADGSLIHSNMREESKEETKPKNKVTDRKNANLFFPFLVILLTAICMIFLIQFLKADQSSGSNIDMESQDEIGSADSKVHDENNNQESMEVSFEYFEVNYSWNYGEGCWTYSLKIPKPAYDYYKTVDREKISNYSYYVTDTTDDEYLTSLAEKFKEAAEEENYSDLDMVKNIILFVQNLNYVDDKVDTGYDEYPKFPLETLTDEGGDCEDSAILLASLLRELGYGTVLIQFPDHMAVGVKGEESILGSYYEMDGIRYYYVETTSTGWEIGEIPDQLKDQPAKILSLEI